MGRAARALLAVVAPFLVLTAPDAVAATKIYSSRSLLARVPGGGELRRTLLVPDAGPVSYLSLSLRVQHPRAADLTILAAQPDRAGAARVRNARRRAESRRGQVGL